MKRLLIAVAALPFLTGPGFAANSPVAHTPIPLSDHQMDKVTAGFDFMELDKTNTSWTLVAVNQGPFACEGTCFLDITSHWMGTGNVSFQLLSQFGP